MHPDDYIKKLFVIGVHFTAQGWGSLWIGLFLGQSNWDLVCVWVSVSFFIVCPQLFLSCGFFFVIWWGTLSRLGRSLPWGLLLGLWQRLKQYWTQCQDPGFHSKALHYNYYQFYCLCVSGFKALADRTAIISPVIHRSIKLLCFNLFELKFEISTKSKKLLHWHM